MAGRAEVTRRSRRWEGRGAGRLGLVHLLLLSFCCFLVVATPASATTRVDGISDQSMPTWDGGFSGSGFAGYFANHWTGGSHVHYARYVVQWNAMSGSGEPYASYRQRFEEWLNDAASLGLTLDVAPTTYPGTPLPSTSAEYKTKLKELLNQAIAQGHPISYIEPWNEPNAQGHETPVAAAHFGNEANTACHEVSPNCTVVAGNYEDTESAQSELESYRGNLNFTPSYWGVHPYRSVGAENLLPFINLRQGLPAGAHVWFTEVAARCSGSVGGSGEAGQTSRANWLVNTLMPYAGPEHVFYYEFLRGNNENPGCSGEEAALYVPSSGDPYTSDRPRPAAAYIFNNAATPQGFTGTASANPNGRQAALNASVYPLNFGESHFRFEYGTTTAYGSSSSEGSSGFGLGPSIVSREIEGLVPNTTYHYRIETSNANGVDYGVDRAFSTPAIPPTVQTSAASGPHESKATLNGSVNPNHSDTHYYFEYGTTKSYGSATANTDAGSGTSAIPVTATITGLRSGTTYHFRLVATNAGGEAKGSDEVFTTPRASRPAVLNVPGIGLTVIWRGSDGNIYDTAAPKGKWETFSPTWGILPPGVTAVGDPAVVQDPTNGLSVIWRGSDGNVYDTVAPKGKWETFSPTWAHLPPGVTAVGDPAALIDPTNGLSVIWRGSDGNVYDSVAPHGTWELFSPTWGILPPGVTAVGDPVALNLSGVGLAVIWRGSDGNVYDTDAPAGKWETFSPTWGILPPGVTAVGDPVALNLSGVGLAVIWRGSDGNVYDTDAPKGKWETFSPTWGILPPGVTAAGDPAAVEDPTNGLSVIWRGSDANAYDTVAPKGKWEIFSPTWGNSVLMGIN